MAKQLKKKRAAKIIIWILAIMFVSWGAGSSAVRSRRKGPTYVGKIYGRKISFEKFAESYEACYHNLFFSSGGNTDLLKQMQESVDINRMAWNRLIVLEEARSQRIKATDEEVIRAIASAPMFNRGGAFDKALYKNIIRNTLRTTPKEFEEETRKSLIIAKLRNRAVEGITVTEGEVLEEYKQRNEKIRISFALIDPEDFKKDITLSAEELKVFYEENAENFRKGDEVSIRYAYIEEDRVDLVRKATEEVNQNKGFIEIAKDNKLEVAETPFFGRNEEIPNIGWSYEVINAAFKMQKGMTSFPIYTKEGYYVINIKEKRTGHLPRFEEAKTEINKRLLKKKAAELAKVSAFEVYNDIKKELEGGSDFGTAAKKFRLDIKKSEPFSRREYIEGIGQANILKAVAFNLPKGRVNPPVECEKGFAIFSVDETIPADEEKFEEEKEKIKQDLLARKRMRVLDDWFNNLSKNAKLQIDLELLP